MEAVNVTLLRERKREIKMPDQYLNFRPQDLDLDKIIEIYILTISS